MNGVVVAYYSGRQTTIAVCAEMAETIALAKLVAKIKHMGKSTIVRFTMSTRAGDTNQQHMGVWVDNTAALGCH